MDDLFQQATGALHWQPETALHTPIPMIEMALRGHYKAQGYEFPDETEPAPVDINAKIRKVFGGRARKAG